MFFFSPRTDDGKDDLQIHSTCNQQHGQHRRWRQVRSGQTIRGFHGMPRSGRPVQCTMVLSSLDRSNSFIFIQILLTWTSIDCSWNLLSQVFWLQLDPAKNSAGNGCSSRSCSEMALTVLIEFSKFRMKTSSDRFGLKSKSVELFQSFPLVQIPF